MTISINIQQPNLNPYSSRQYNADVNCECCGRGIANRDNAHVVQVMSRNRETGDTIFARIEWSKVAGRDSVEWGSFVGSHCAKQIPRGYKVSQKRVIRAMSF